MTRDSRSPARPAPALTGAWPAGVRLPRLLGYREWVAKHAGHEIRVVARGPLPALLLVDGRPVDRRFPFLSLDRELPLLGARLPSLTSEVLMVEVFFNLPFATQVVVRAGNRRLQTVECR